MRLFYLETFSIYGKRYAGNSLRNYCNAVFVSDVLDSELEASPRCKKSGGKRNIWRVSYSLI